MNFMTISYYILCIVILLYHKLYFKQIVKNPHFSAFLKSYPQPRKNNPDYSGLFRFWLF
jgi:hypothetical protein